MKGWSFALALTLSATAACGKLNEQPPLAGTRLPAGIVARVGARQLASASVVRVVEGRGIGADAAFKLALTDALFAEAARENAPPGVVASIERGAAAYALLEQVASQSKLTGSVSDAEIDAIARERWLEFDRPDAVLTTHAVVLNGDPARAAAARKVAARLAEVVASAPDAAEFLRLATGVPSEGFEVRAESLPTITADGRAFLDRDGKLVASSTSFDLAYARAANALEQPSQQSPIISSQFGFHVIRLEKRVPGTATAPAQRRALLEPEVWSRRASRARQEHVARLREATPIERDRAADELTSRVKAVP